MEQVDKAFELSAVTGADTVKSGKSAGPRMARSLASQTSTKNASVAMLMDPESFKPTARAGSNMVRKLIISEAADKGNVGS